MTCRILLTGGNGFIGKNIRELVSEEYSVISPKSSELNLLNKNAVTDYLCKNTFDYIFHCAGVGVSRGDKVNSVLNDNLKMFQNLFNEGLKTDTKLVLFGSGAEYNKGKPLEKVKETEYNLSVPKDPYGYAKYLISKEINDYDNVVVLRLFGVYGKYEDYVYRFISNAIIRNLLKLPITINRNLVFDYLYVNDLVQLLEKMVNRFPRYKYINVTPDESIDLVSIAYIVNEMSDYSSEIRVINPGLGKSYTGDNGRLREEFPDFEFTPIHDGVKELYDYYNRNLELFDSGKLLLDPRVR